MFKNRFFYFMVIAALVAIAALLAYQMVTTAKAVTAGQQLPVTGSLVDPTNPCPFNQDEILSLHPVWVAEIGQWMSYTDHGPVGVDGGKEALRNCPAIGK